MFDDGPFTSPGQARSGIYLTTSAFITQMYQEQTGQQAGACVHQDKATGDAQDDDKTADQPFYLFKNSGDYALALWFQEIGCTKGEVNSFFNSRVSDHYMKGVAKRKPEPGLSFANGEQWLGQLDRIPTGICDDNWQELRLTVETEVEEQEPSTVKLQYSDVVSSIKFLLGHPPFALDLVYGPICQYNNKNERVYIEMHTGDWWWEMQEQLPDGSTIVPLLIGTDKTVLTQHHGDVAAWPVYLTIGNLKADVRRQQNWPGSLLLGFISVEASGDTKAKIWHMALGVMLKRKYIITIERSTDPG